ncbi:MAG: glycosyltransferase family 2 protein [Candidatus Levybacteria bacterium]|nr:glycosyltransferase family 2 protein [Candidatus Levybacteria bacterium]
MISVVVPVFNEEESILHFYDELMRHLPKLSKSYEIIFVDDGSADNTLNLAKELAKKDKNISIYSFRRNHGKAEALTFGFQKAKEDLILTLDADLQDKPSEVKKLFNKQKEGFDLVSGWREHRRDSFAKIIFSKFFNLMASTFWGVRLHDYNCGLKLYTKDAAKSLNLYGGMHRFIPLLVAEKGFRVTEVPVVHDIRRFGKSKYNAIKLLTQSPDMMTMLFLSKYGKRPLHFFGFIGIFIFGVGVLISLYLSILHFLGEPIGTRPLLFLGILLIISGIQIGLTGLIADLVLNVSRKNSFSEIMLKYSSENI